MSTEHVESEIRQRLGNAGLLSALVLDSSQYLDFPDSTFVELVLNDDSKRGDVSKALGSLDEDSSEGKPVSLLVRSIWTIEKVGEPEQARSESGGMVAARILPVWLKSGTASLKIEVSITRLAEMELERLLETDLDLKLVARAYVQNYLQWGGKSAWDPTQHRYLEISADRALSVKGMLKNIA